MNHPITDLPFNYDKCCNTCAHFSDKTRTLRGVKHRTIRCALVTGNLNDTHGTVWKALPACTQHKGR